MRNLFYLIAAAGFVLAATADSEAATLTREEPKERRTDAHGLSETNAQLVVSIAGLSLLPEKDAGAGTAGDHTAGAEVFAFHDGDGDLMLAFLRSMQRANTGGSFAADTTSTTGADSSDGNASGQLAASGDALDAIRALQQSGVVAVPEPSTYALLGAGALLMAFKARHYRIRSPFSHTRYSSR